MARLYANEDFPLPVVEALLALGHDVLTTAETGMAGRAVPGAEVLAFAANDARAVVTFNRRDFVRLHRARSPRADTVVCSVDADFEGLARRIHETVTRDVGLDNQLLRVHRPAR